MSIDKTKAVLQTGILGIILLGLTAYVQAAGPSLKVGSASGAAGTSVTVPVSFDPGSGNVAALQFNLTLPPGVTPGAITASDTLKSTHKTANSGLHGNVWTIVVFGMDLSTISKGPLLMAELKIAPGTAAGTVKLPVSGVAYSDPKGTVVKPGQITSGKITIKSLTK